MQAPQSRWPRWVVRLILALLFCGAIAALIAFIAPLLLFTAMAHDFRTISEVTVGDLAKEADLNFPADARITHFEEKPPIDPIWVARIVVPPDAEDALAKSVARHPSIDVHVIGALSESKAWWKPLGVILKTHFYHPQTNALVTVVLARESGRAVAYVEHAF